jgi:Lysozyme like domain
MPVRHGGGGAAGLSYAQLEGVWLKAARGTKYATRKWAALMAAIALAESSGIPWNVNRNDNNGKQTSWGLWQISNGTHSEVSANWNNPYVNARLAVDKLQSQGLGAWGTYTSGAYKAFLSDRTTPDTSGLDNAAAEGTAPLSISSGNDCLWGIGTPGLAATFGGLVGAGLGALGIGGSHEFCVLSKSQARAVVGFVALGGGIAVGLFGVLLLGRVTGIQEVGALRPGGQQQPAAAPAAAAVAAPEAAAAPEAVVVQEAAGKRARPKPARQQRARQPARQRQPAPAMA